MKPNPYDIEHTLPEELPASPMPLFRAWFDEAREKKIQPNPNAMALATVDRDGRPSARTVLCKGIDEAGGRITFYTNRNSRKGRAIADNQRVAVLFHWDAFDRQARFEGVVTPTSDEESDAYFHSRRLESRIGAWASDQSEPIESREALLTKVVDVMTRFGVNLDLAEETHIPRPPHWGGYHITADRIELWVGGPGRVHDRAVWTRDVQAGSGQLACGEWRSTRLQP